MPDQSIIIKFQAKGNEALERAIIKLDHASRQLKNQTNKLRKQGGLLDTTFTKNRKSATLLGNAFATLRSKMLLVNFAMGLGITQLVRFAQESARVKNMETAFNELSGGVGNATVSLEKLRQATDGTMSSFDLFQQANNAMILGVTKNSDEMAEMFDMAQRLGRALGRDTASSVESLITGIGRQSRLMLDNIGIIVKSDEAYKSYANEIGKSVNKLTDAEKKQAFFNATLESARQKLKSLPDETLTTQDRFDQLSSSTSELTLAIGNALTPVLTKAAVALTKVVNATTDLFTTDDEERIKILKKEIKFLEDRQEKSKQEKGKFKNNFIFTTQDLKDLANYKSELMKLQKVDFPESMKIEFPRLTEENLKAEEIEKQLFAMEMALTNMSNLEFKLPKSMRLFMTEEAEKFMDDIEKIDISETIEENIANLKKLQDEVKMSTFGMAKETLSALQSNLDARVNAEISALKETEAYKKADSERRKDMERNVRKSFASEQKMLFRGNQLAALADLGFNTSSAIMKAIAAFPFTGGMPFVAIIKALAGVQAAMILSQQPPKYQSGGMIGGRRHSQGGTMIEAEQGEFIMSRGAVESVGIETMNRINQTGSAGVTVNISGNVMSQDFVEGELAERIKEAVRKGSNFGMS